MPGHLYKPLDMRKASITGRFFGRCASEAMLRPLRAHRDSTTACYRQKAWKGSSGELLCRRFLEVSLAN
jgi:hypothetical protein